MVNTISRNMILLILSVVLIGTFNTFPCFAYDGNEFNHNFRKKDLQEIVDVIPPGLGPIDVNGILVSRVIEINDDDWNLDWDQDEGKDDDLDEEWIEQESEYNSWSENRDKERSEVDHNCNDNRDIEKVSDDSWDVDWDADWDFEFHTSW